MINMVHIRKTEKQSTALEKAINQYEQRVIDAENKHQKAYEM